MGDTMKDDCGPTGKKKELIITALQAGDQEMKRLAKCIEDGKVTINGCTTFTAQADEALMKLFDLVRPASPSEARMLMLRGLTVINAEKQAIRSYNNMNATFYQRVHDALNDQDLRINKSEERRRIEQQIAFKEVHIEQLKRKLERL